MTHAASPSTAFAWPRGAGWIALILCIAICQSVGVAGALLTDTGDSAWYRALRKPAFNPPSWVFGPVWTTLYLMMGVVLYQLLRRRASPGATAAITAFIIQLALNAAWTPIFFGLHAMFAALAVIILLWVAIGATIVLAWRVSRAAAWLLVPYWLWVTYATVLNASIAMMNRGA